MKKVKLAMGIVAFVCCLNATSVFASNNSIQSNNYNSTKNEVTPRGANIPTSRWNLYNNNYSWSAYINNSRLYSNYYFHVETPHRYHFFGYKRYDASAGYYARVHSKDYSGRTYSRYVPPTEAGFNWYHYELSSLYDMGYNFYFSIDGSTTNAAVSLDGQMNTY